MSKRNWPENYLPPPWLPDWRFEDEYTRLLSDTDYTFDEDINEYISEEVATSKREFGWEFLRRDPSYQSDYTRLIALAQREGVLDRYKKPLGFNIFDMNHKPLKSIWFHAELYRTLQKWGMGYYLLDPSMDVINTAPLPAISRLGTNSHPAVHVEYFPPKAIATPDAGKSEPIPVDGGIIPGENESYWLFDISLPIEPQLQKAKKFLEMAQIRKYKKKISASKTDLTKFTLYLRILDADARGADEKEIMAELFPGEDGLSYSDKNGDLYKNDSSHRNPGRDMLKNSRKAAYYLRDKGYRFLF
jgi:hypothetical protein